MSEMSVKEGLTAMDVASSRFAYCMLESASPRRNSASPAV